MTILSVLDGNGNERKFDFELKQNPNGSSDTLWQIKSKKEFVFLSDANTRERYDFTLEGTANGQTNTFGFKGQLSNEPPVAQVNWPDVRYNGGSINPPTFPAGDAFEIAGRWGGGSGSVVIVEANDFFNGSIANSENFKQLVYSCDFRTNIENPPGFFVNYSPNFSLTTSSNGSVTLNLLNIGFFEAEANFTLKISDANGNGDFIEKDFNVSVKN